MPLHQQRTRNSIPPRRRRDRSRHPQTLQHNPELLVIRPAAAPTGLNHLEPLNLSTLLIDVHKDCYKSINKTKQGGRHRRETPLNWYFNRRFAQAWSFAISMDGWIGDGASDCSLLSFLLGRGCATAVRPCGQIRRIAYRSRVCACWR